MSHMQPEDRNAYSEPERQQAQRLLSLCMPLRTVPAEALVARLEQPDSAEWVRTVLGRVRPAGHPGGLEIVADGAGGIAAAEALKELGKRSFSRDHDAGPTASLCYTTAVAAALAHHSQLISSRSPWVVQEHLEELACLLPPEICGVVERGIEFLLAQERSRGAGDEK